MNKVQKIKNIELHEVFKKDGVYQEVGKKTKNVKILICLIIVVLIFSSCLVNKKEKLTHWEESLCCRNAIQDSVLNWCEKIALMEKCDYITSPCINGFAFKMASITKLPPSVTMGTYGFNYFTGESFNKDVQMWKEALGCPIDTISKKP